MGNFDYRAEEFPAIRIAESVGSGTNKNLLFVVGGGLGDRMCAQPTINYAFHRFKNCTISLLCDTPELFNNRRSSFHRIYKHHSEVPARTFLALHTYQQGLFNQFISANGVHPVDFASISALRMVLEDKVVSLPFFDKNPAEFARIKRKIVIHMGDSWESRTFPDPWWNELISTIESEIAPVVLIGKRKSRLRLIHNLSEDLTNSTDLETFISICFFADCLLTNDSSPVHFAGPNLSVIIPTVKRPDLLTHVGKRQVFASRFDAAGNMWNQIDWCPNSLDAKDITKVPYGKSILEFIPPAMDVAEKISLNWRKK